MDSDLSSQWDYIAKELRSQQFKGWHSYYHGHSFLISIKKALKYLSKKNVKILKTDLWNEGIETERDVLGFLEKNLRFDTYGMDISSKVCIYAKRRLRRTKIIQADIRNLPFPDQFFDIVLDLSTIDHIPEEETKRVIEEYYRVLSSSGILVLIFCYNSLFVKISKLCGFKKDKMQYYFNLYEILEEVQTKFNIEEKYIIGVLKSLPWGFFLKRLPPRVYKFIGRRCIQLEHSSISYFLLRPFGELCVIIAKRKN